MTKEKRKVKINIGNGSPIISQKPGRNTKCKCGSGKKQKHCCGDSTSYLYSKPTKTNKITEPIKDENHEQI